MTPEIEDQLMELLREAYIQGISDDRIGVGGSMWHDVDPRSGKTREQEFSEELGEIIFKS